MRISVRVSILDYDILALDIAQFAQSPAERVGAVQLSVGGGCYKKSYPGNFRWLLSRDAKGERKEDGPKRVGYTGQFLNVACCLLPDAHFHLITLFARSRTRFGIIRPICFAAFRLTMNSNLVACCTGKSTGLAPLKILST